MQKSLQIVEDQLLALGKPLFSLVCKGRDRCLIQLSKESDS